MLGVLSTSARIDRFRIWLWSNGTSEDIAMFEPTIVASILALAGRSPVQLAHITAACKRAREAGRDPAPTEALGRLLVRSEAPARPAGVKTNAQPKLVVVETVRQPAEGPRWSAPRPGLGNLETEPAERPELGSVGLQPESVAKVSLEAARRQVAAAPETRPRLALVEPSSQPEVPKREAAPPAGDAVAPSIDFARGSEPPLVAVTIRAKSRAEMPVPAKPPATTPARRRIDRRVMAGIVAIPVVATVALVMREPASDGDSEPDTRPSATAQTAASTATALGARFPSGWRDVGAGRFVRGDAGDPTHEAYVATVPLHDGSTDDTLLSLARDAERGAIGSLDTHAIYRPIGCEPTGARTAACRGELAGGLLLQTYVRAGDRRAAVALFIAKLPLADARRETDAIVAALEP